MDFKRFAEIEAWYNRQDVKFELIKGLKNRETCAIVPSWCEDEMRKKSVRMLKCHSVQHLEYILQRGLRMFEKQIPYNLYYSLARYIYGIPNQTFNLEQRDNSAWEKDCHKEIDAYDFLIDIDAGEHEDILEAHESTKLIVSFFNENNIPFELRFSGKGFHILIPYNYFFTELLNRQILDNYSFNPKMQESIYSLYSKIAKALNKRFSEMIDVSIYDSRRVCKMPFSLSIYDKEIYVCYPYKYLSEFDVFDLSHFALSTFEITARQENRKVFNQEGTIAPLLEMI